MNSTTTASSTTAANKSFTTEFGWLLIALATAMQLARIVGMTASNGELPFLSANDRSRWCAIAALTEDGAWEIDRFFEIKDSKGKPKLWYTIDMVRHVGPDGKEHFYSSKPPLLTVMYAAICKPVTMILGKKLTEDPFLVGRTMMVIVNLIPLLLWWIWIYRWLEANVRDDWSRFILFNAALWGTFLTTFAATLNNHLHGAFFFTISLTYVWRMIEANKRGESVGWVHWVLCGVVSGLTVACELPALAWAAAAAFILLFVDWRRMLIGYGAGSAAIAVAFLITNYWAHGDLRPPYSHRGLGTLITKAPLDQTQSADPQSKPNIETILAKLDQKKYPFTANTTLEPARLDNVHQLIDATIPLRVAIRREGSDWAIYQWDDWYDYPKSYWLPGEKKGVDMGEPNRWLYLVHFLVGHHGVFSLTPLWICSIVGAFIMIRSTHVPWLSKSALHSQGGIAAIFVAVTLACIVFYTSRDVVDRNYAGVCSGFRWLFWLIPAWLWLAVPAIERASSGMWSRRLVGAALIVSIFSATVPWPNPWTHPWPYRIQIWIKPEPLPPAAAQTPAATPASTTPASTTETTPAPTTVPGPANGPIPEPTKP